MFLLKGKVMDNLDKFFVYGINHNDLNLLEREKFVIDFKPYKLMRKLIEEKKVEDCLIISTCLRNEFYFWNEKENIKEYKCECCGNTEWNKKPIALELHHVNGIKNDLRLENLQILCPNCHAFTDNYRGKNIGIK